jgi:hypothetical protein
MKRRTAPEGAAQPAAAIIAQPVDGAPPRRLGTRENAAEKARRYLAEGRLLVLKVDDKAGVVAAEARGDGATYACGYAQRHWYCTCPAKGRCCHLLALGLVVAVEGRER